MLVLVAVGREGDVKARRTKREIPPIHPGDLLKTEFLDELGMSVAALARAIGVPRSSLNDFVHGRQRLTAELAMRLGRYFGTSAELWMGLRTHYELEVAAELLGDRLEREITPRKAA